MSVWTFVINRILISTNTIMIKFKKALVVLCAFCAISSQNLDDIFHVGLSYSWIHPIEVAQDFDSIPEDVIGDSILLNIYFEVVDTAHIDSFKFVINSNEPQELSYPFAHYVNDFDSILYRQGNYLVTELGVFPYDTLLTVGVCMVKGTFTTPYLYESIIVEE